MTLQEMTMEQLKALAYDTLVQVEQHQNNLRIINGEIARRNTPMSEETTPVVEEETAVESTEATPEVE